MAEPRGLHEDEIQEAVKALSKHIEKQKGNCNDLLEEDELLYLVRLQDFIDRRSIIAPGVVFCELPFPDACHQCRKGCPQANLSVVWDGILSEGLQWCDGSFAGDGMHAHGRYCS
jgi:hypothetical protein